MRNQRPASSITPVTANANATSIARVGSTRGLSKVERVDETIERGDPAGHEYGDHGVAEQLERGPVVASAGAGGGSLDLAP